MLVRYLIDLALIGWEGWLGRGGLLGCWEERGAVERGWEGRGCLGVVVLAMATDMDLWCLRPGGYRLRGVGPWCFVSPAIYISSYYM